MVPSDNPIFRELQKIEETIGLQFESIRSAFSSYFEGCTEIISSIFDQLRDLLMSANTGDYSSIYNLLAESKKKLRKSDQRARQIRGIKPANRLIRIRSPAG
jgi:hypothetical protein